MHDVYMRTTLTLDPDVAACVRRETAGGKRRLKEVINERLRIGFGMIVQESAEPFRVNPHRSAYRAGVDAGKLNQLVDELQVESSRPHKKASRDRS